MEIPVGNKGIPPLLVAGHCNHSCNHRLNQSVFSSVDMPTADRISLNPATGGSYYYPSEDFDTWRAQFKALCRPQQWPDSVAKPLAFAYMGDSANEAVMDIPYNGPETLSQLLDAYGTRLQLFEDLRILRLRGEELFQDPRRQSQSGMRRRSLLKPRPTRGILMPTQRLSPEGNRGLIVRIETPVGQLEEIALPPNVKDIRRRTLVERTRHLIRESEDGTPAHSAEDIRNRILFEQARPRPRGPEDSNLPGQKDSGRLVKNQTEEPLDEWDFPLRQ